MRAKRNGLRVTSCVAIAGAFLAGGAAAGESGAVSKQQVAVETSESSIFDDIWSLGNLYENDDNPVIQSLVLSGRLQVDAAFFDGYDGEDSFEKLLWRRFRFGFKAKLFENFTFHSEADIDLNNLDFDDLDDSYGRLTDTYLAWSRGDAFKLKVGKQSAPFTLDGATSSKKLITMERSNVANNLWFPREYFTGVAALGEVGNWSYHTGVYSSSGDDEFGSFDSGYFGLVSLGYNFAERTGLDNALVRVDYAYNDPDYSGNVGTRDLKHIASLVGKFDKDRYGVWSNLAFAKGIGSQSDLFGLQLMPYYDISDQWQAVFRYTYVNGSDDNGVRVNRYESRVARGRSDAAHEFFAGLNWYLYGHRLKWQNGLEYVYASDSANDGGGYDGWGLTSGIRISW